MTSNLTAFLKKAEASFTNHTTNAEAEENYDNLEKQFHQIMEFGAKAGAGMKKAFLEASEEEKNKMRNTMKNVGDLVHKIIRFGDEKEREIFNRTKSSSRGPRSQGKGKGKGKGKGRKGRKDGRKEGRKEGKQEERKSGRREVGEREI
jgi:hypothetical protein